MNWPLVSVVIPMHNSSGTIARTLDSVLRQTYRPIEVIIVDDCSTDAAVGIVRGYKAPVIRLVQLSERGGASGARNVGIESATGELVAFLDSDDEWLPNKLMKQVALITSNPQLVFVSCSSKLFSPKGEDLGDLYHGRRPVYGAVAWKGLLACNTIATPSVLVWRRHLSDLGGFSRSLKVGEDQDMWIRLSLLGDIGYVEECLVHVHARERSLSSGGYAEQLEYTLPMIKRHVAAQRDRLTTAEVRAILGERLERIGRAACGQNYGKGLELLLRSALYRYKPTRSAIFLANAAPPIRFMKKTLRAKARSQAGSLRTSAATRGGSGRMVATGGRSLHPMLPTDEAAVIRFGAEERPRLVVIVDTEEEFDWRKPFSRANMGVCNMRAQFRAQEIYQRYGIVPTYALDYPIVVQEEGYRPLIELHESGGCELGAQLHAWVTPPFEEEVCERNSFACNLPVGLERRKLETLTHAIERRFGVRPLLYRAGRYGAGASTPRILDDLGYEVDCSVLPGIGRGSHYAPDYSGATAHPFWLATRRPILELPVTVGTVGPAQMFGEPLYDVIASDLGRRLRLPGIMARAHLLNRIRLSPEGNTLEESKHLTRRFIENGHRIFAVSYHSPSLEPGNTPYVTDQADLDRFLSWIEGYVRFFFEEMNGVADTPRGLRSWALSHSAKYMQAPERLATQAAR
jgi:glycosyltransferase involved in cell wall biosynthesis